MQNTRGTRWLRIKKLYISDLDGTLLNQDALISPKSKLLLNAAIENGAAFTIATARSIAMTQPLIGGLDLHWPIILMNGVFLYDPISRRYIRALTLAPSTVRCLGELFERNQIPYFLYTLQDETLVLYHHPMKSWQEQHFWERRQGKPEKRFEQTDAVPYMDDSLQTVYFAVVGKKALIDQAAALLGNIWGIRFAYYSDVYEPDMWYLEIFHPDADKANAAKEFARRYRFEYICAFGDNYNDLALFECADESCAVANAVEPLKAIASHVIGANTDDGVARWLHTRFCKDRLYAK